MTLRNLSSRGRGQGQVTPVNFWALNANCSIMAKDTDFKFEEHIPCDSPDSRQIPLKILSTRGRGQGHVTPIFCALNANCSTTVKDTDFIFDKHVPWDEKLLRGNVRTVPRNALVKFEVRNFDRSRTIDI